MEILLRTVTILNIFLTTLHCVAIGLTIFRFQYRYRTGRLWWDDYFAAVAAGIDTAAIAALWMGYAHSDPLQTVRSKTILYSVGLISVAATDWATRISLALAFARIFPPSEPTRVYAVGLASLFATLFVSILIQGILVCRRHSSWIFNTGIIQCNFSRRVLIYGIVVNVLGDILLVCSPIYTLRRVKLPQNQRRLIFTCIAGSTLMSLAGFATSVFQIAPTSWEPGRGFIRVLLGYLESGVSLTICNLLVVVTYIYTVTHRNRHTLPQVVERETKACSNPALPTMGFQSTRMAVPTSMDTIVTLTEISDAYLTD
ncbi:hypothetical protein BDN70DRAFT_997964 [Pholiota conissans]|uniref:Rhodopsin domain-containing protein n=1 Tax=Pholiota conissans TaxID=109636 RepID=A0A9P5YQG8_9AGAR|nr:hypothetical protein BDN70DRAFT_997964 [Pholiota conissans]